MKATYGYKDASGDFFITIDTDLCNGCGACVTACPASVLMVGEDENDPLNENPVAAVTTEQRKKVRYSCAQRKPPGHRPPPLCQKACKLNALSHTW